MVLVEESSVLLVSVRKDFDACFTEGGLQEWRFLHTRNASHRKRH